MNDVGALNGEVGKMVDKQMDRQARVLDSDAPDARLEWNSAEKMVADMAEKRALGSESLSDLLDEGRLVIRWRPLP